MATPLFAAALLLMPIDGPAAPLPEPALTRNVAGVDLNRDGIPDLVTSYDTPGGPWIEVRLGRAALLSTSIRSENLDDPFEESGIAVPISHRGDFLAPGDFDGDGAEEIAIAARGARTLTVLTWSRQGWPATTVMEAAGAVRAVGAGDFGRLDGRTDLIVSVTGVGTTVLTEKGAHRTLSTIEADALALAPVGAPHFGSVLALRGRELRMIGAESETTYSLPFDANTVTAGRFGHGGTVRIAASGPEGLALIDPGNGRIATWRGAPAASESPLIPLYRTGAPGHDLLAGGVVVPHGALAALDAERRMEGALPTVLPANETLTTRRVAGAAVMRLGVDALADVVLATTGPAPEIFRTRARRTFVVNSTDTDGDGDLTDGICDTGPDGDGNYLGICTLNAAVSQSNSSAGADIIQFSIPGGGPVVVPGGLTFTDVITVDGTSQGGYAGSPLIIFQDSKVSFEAGNSVLRGVVMNSADPNARAGVAVELIRVGNNVIESNWFGLDAAGSSAEGASWNVWIRTPNNTVGGAAESARNVLSGAYEGDGVLIAGPSATGNVVRGNFVGTDASGSAAAGNFLRGVAVSNAASGNTVRDNLISGNGTTITNPADVGGGVALQFNAWLVDIGSSDPVDQPPTGNLVVGNLIGTDRDGAQALPNIRGILIDHALDNTIGGAADSLKNVISGNTREGIFAFGTYGTTSGNQILGNHVGVTEAGADSLGNRRDGIRLSSVSDHTLSGNVISGNKSRGVGIESSSGITVSGNHIGLDIDGRRSLGNVSSGIQVASSTSVQIGLGTTAGRNLISDNNGGVFISGNSTGVTVRGNYIGTDATGLNNHGNGFDGVRVLGESGIVVGGAESGEGNLIAFNALNGVGIFNGTGVTVRGNEIRDNGNLGIDLGINGVTANDVGDSDSGPNNLQNFPTLGFLDSERLLVGLSSLPSTTFTLEFFALEECDESDYGEGTRFLGAQTVTTDGSGELDYETSFDLTDDEDFVTATATAPDGSTSEFSRCSDDLRLIVNTTGSSPDADPDDPVCDTGTRVLRNGEEEPECTLRAAIQQANANDGEDAITFDIIQGSAPYVIRDTPPTISDEVSIDATTQAGYVSREPAVVLDGPGAEDVGLFATAPLTLRGMVIRGFEVGLRTSVGSLTLHDLTLTDNSELGLSADGAFGSEIRVTGLLTASDNGSEGLPNCSGHTGGIIAENDFFTEDIVLTGNCGDGLWNVVKPVTVNGNALATDNTGVGFRALDLTLNGTAHELSRNGEGAAYILLSTSNGTIDVTGSLTVSDNGDPEGFCDQGDVAALMGRTIRTGDLVVTGNCYSGVWATSGTLTVDGNLTVMDNRLIGMRADEMTITGQDHVVQSNGLNGLRTHVGDLVVRGTLQVQFNGKDDEPECPSNDTPALFSARNLELDDVLVHANCGDGLHADRSVIVEQRLRSTSNGRQGAHASGGNVILRGTDHTVNGNAGVGLEARGLSVVAVEVHGNFSIASNDSSGVVGSNVFLPGPGSVCANGRWGVEVWGGELAMGAVSVCNNAGGGIRSITAETTGKTSPNALVSGASVTGNGGDGIRFEGGTAFTITGSNLFGNAGLALNNLDPSVTLVADGNWWGDPAGGGAYVSGNVTTGSPLVTPVAGEDDDGDSLSNALEDAGPNNGDADQNGFPDRLEPHVAALPYAGGTARILLVSDSSTPFVSLRTFPAPDTAGPSPAAFDFGLIDAVLTTETSGGSASVAITYPSASAWSSFDTFAGGTQDPLPAAVITDATVTVEVSDGSDHDADATTNSQIRITGGPRIGSGTSVEEQPTGLILAGPYPNPASSAFVVRPGPGLIRYALTDLTGRRVRTGTQSTGSPLLRVSVADLPAGVYFLTLSGTGRAETRPVLVVR